MLQKKRKIWYELQINNDIHTCIDSSNISRPMLIRLGSDPIKYVIRYYTPMQHLITLLGWGSVLG